MKAHLRLALILFLCRLPFLAYYYPGCVPGDTFTSISQWHGIRDFTADLSGAGGDVVFTNHLPFFTTIIFGSFYDLGELMGNPNLGLFLLSLIFTALFCDIVARMLCRLCESRVVMILACVYALFPYFGLWSVDLVKDTLMALAMLWLTYGLMCREPIASMGRGLISDWWFSGVLLLFMLTKNQCPYIVVLLAVVLLLCYRRSWQLIALRFGAALVVYYAIWMSIVLPAANVSPVGKQEVMGALFQQSARSLIEHPEDISREEKLAINAMLPHAAEVYTPALQDPVKFRYNSKATSAQFREYLCAWASVGLRHPSTYLAATWENCNAYFVPGLCNGKDIYPLASTGENHNVETTEGMVSNRSNLSFLQRIPIVGMFLTIGSFIWLLIFTALYVIWQKKEALIIMAPSLIQLLVLILSPENGCYRYVVPILWCLPIYVALVLTTTRSEVPQ